MVVYMIALGYGYDSISMRNYEERVLKKMKTRQINKKGSCLADIFDTLFK
jgi:hypothetical protein